MNGRNESKDKRDSTLSKNVDNDNMKHRIKLQSDKNESKHQTDYVFRHNVDNNTK